MSDLRDKLSREFEDPDFRYGYAQSFLNTKIASQIRILREQRRKSQTEMSLLVGTKQAGFSRFEDVNHSVWKTDTLWKIARALGVRLNISFETFGSLIDEKERFRRDYLTRPSFEEDPAFRLAEEIQPGMDEKIPDSLVKKASGQDRENMGQLCQFPTNQLDLQRRRGLTDTPSKIRPEKPGGNDETLVSRAL